jgi:hypothetical protein
MSAYYSTKKDGWPVPKELIEQHDRFVTHQPAEYIDSEADGAEFAKIYGQAALDYSREKRTVPENVEEKWVWAGLPHYYIGGTVAVSTGIPEVGEPAWVRRIEAKLDAIRDKVALLLANS